MARGGSGGRGKKQGATTRLTPTSLAAHAAAATSGPAPPARLTGKCLECGVAKSASVPFQPGVDACKAHWDRYLSLTHVGSFDEYVRMKGTDEDLAAKAEEAQQVIDKKKAPTWAPTEVREDDRVTVRTIQPMIGPSRAQLVSWMGVTPEELGIQLQNLQDVHKNSYKGVLLPDPMRPYTCFEFVSDSSIAKAQVRMPAEKQCYEQQADDSFAYLKTKRFEEDKATKDLLTKMRTSPWTFESMIEKCAEVRKKKGMPAVPPVMQTVATGGCIPGSAYIQGLGLAMPDAAAGLPPSGVAEALGGNSKAAGGRGDGEEEDEDGDDDEDAEEMADAAMVGVGPGLNFGGVHDSISCVGGAANKRKRKGNVDDGASSRTGISPGAKTARIRTVDGVPVADDDKSELIKRRIKSADISEILAGEAKGREIGWLERTRNSFQTVGDESNASILTEHLRVCNAASKLAAESIAKMPAPALQEALKDLTDAQVVLPPAMQLALYKREVADLQTNLDESKVEKLMQTVLPWSVPDADADSGFNNLSPKLCDVSGSVAERSSLFMDGVLNGIIPLVKQGEPLSDNVVKIAASAMKYLDMHSDADEAEEYDDVLGKVLMGLSVLRAVKDPFLVMYDKTVSELDTFGNQKGKEVKSSALYQLYLALKLTPYWWGLREEHIARGPGTAKHLESIQKFQKELVSAGDPIASGVILSILKVLSAYMAECKHLLYSGLKEAVEKQAVSSAKAYFDKQPDVTKDGLTVGFETWRKTLELMCDNLPSSMGAAKEYLKKLASWESQLCRHKALGDFDSLAKGVTKETFGDDSKRAELILATRKVTGHGGEVSGAQKMQLDKLVELALAYVIEDCETVGKARPVIEFLSTLSNSGFVSNSVDIKQRIQKLETWANLEKAIEEIMALGQGPAAQAGAQAVDSCVRELRSVLKSLELGSFITTASSKYKERISFGAKIVNDIAGHMIKAVSAEVTSVVDAIRPDAGGDEEGRAWTLKIPAGDEDDIDKVMTVAQKVLGRMDGKLFSHKLEVLETANNRQSEVHDLFEMDRPCTDTADVIAKATVTKYTSLMVYQFHENQKTPNPSKLRRSVKKYRTSLESHKAQVQPAIWKWSASVSKF